MAISTAVGLELVAKIVGYQLNTGDFSESTRNLPMRIAILGEANTANQGGLDLTPKPILSAQEAAVDYGYGSPLYSMMRILRPINSGGIGGIPTIVYPQESSGATAAEREITVTGTATGNGTHTVVINGRKGIDGGKYDITVVTNDTPTIIAAKITDAVNAVLGAPVIASSALGVAACLAKWTGLTSESLDIEVLTNGNALGLTYVVASTETGAGSPSVVAALNLFQENWNTIVINSYGEVANTDLETFNGKPDETNPTGRYQGIIMKPFVALYGDTTTDPSTLTDARLGELTNAVCPAPNSKGFDFEAAANMAVLFGRIVQDTPHLDVSGKSYPDMPIPADEVIGSMSDYIFRNSLVEKGSSTVILVAGRYQIEDFVTTYHPIGEVPPQFRYPRNLFVDFNIRFTYLLAEQIHVLDKAIAADNDVVTATNVIKPKMWLGVVDKMAVDFGKRALIADVPFMQNGIIVGLSENNPDRMETSFPYKRTGTVRIAATTVKAGFNFGNV